MTIADQLEKRGYTVTLSHESDDGPTIYHVEWERGNLFLTEDDTEIIEGILALDPTAPPPEPQPGEPQ